MYQPKSRLGTIIHGIEETILASLLAGMTLVAFTQVIARYVFNSGAVWALEAQTLMFAWMVLFGASYGIKIGGHLGVDAFIRWLPKPVFRGIAVFGGLCGIIYALILIPGAWIYLGKMYKIGIRTEDLEIPRWIAYSILLIGLVLFALRCAEACWQIIRGERETIAASHEAEELVEENKGVVAD